MAASWGQKESKWRADLGAVRRHQELASGGPKAVHMMIYMKPGEEVPIEGEGWLQISPTVPNPCQAPTAALLPETSCRLTSSPCLAGEKTEVQRS